MKTADEARAPPLNPDEQCPIDCGDNSCVCAGPRRGGMRTNAGCCCTERSLRHAVQWWRRHDRAAEARGRLEADTDLVLVRAALARLLEWLDPPGGIVEWHDRWASLFHAETGLYAPGKDVPAAVNLCDEDEARRRPEWDRWIAARRKAVVDAGRHALASGNPPKAAPSGPDAVRKEGIMAATRGTSNPEER